MLTKVSMTGIATPREFTIGGVDPDDTIILKSISGLTPSDATLFTGDYAGNGGYYQGRRFGGRNVVFNFKLNPDYSVGGRSVSSLRQELYSMFIEPTYYQDYLQVFLYDDEEDPRTVNVYYDKYQGDIFSQDTSVQISTQCVDPYIIGQFIQYFAPSGGVLSVPVQHNGTAPTGLQVNVVANVTTTQFSVDFWGKKMTYVGDVQAGDIFTIITEDGNQAITRYRAPNIVSVLGGLTADSQWLTVNKGLGTLRAYGPAVGDGKMAITGYHFTEKWLGV